MEKIKVAPEGSLEDVTNSDFLVRAVVFDLDGTLVDSLQDIARAVNSTLEAHGRRGHPLPAFKGMVGWGLRRLLETASAAQPFSSEEFDTVYQELVSTYRSNPVDHTRPYDGIVALLDSLQGLVPLGVLSNKEDGMTKAIVRTLFPHEFHSVWGARPGKPHKPDPSSLWEMLDGWGVPRSQCAYLGDSDVDMETATRAGVFPCGAAWGFRGEAELRSAGARVVFAQPRDFGLWLARHGAPVPVG